MHSIVANCLRLLFVIVLLAANWCDGANDVLGCGGFVKSVVSIDFSNIHIKLYTLKGVVKYATDCAPNNGYYFIPLYDKGDYILKISPPDGWAFEPSSVPLKIDGETDLCSLQRDIDFTFKGFTVSGKVFSEGSNTGPTGVSLTLRAKLTNNELKSTVSGVDGIYQFKEVLPGDYVIEAFHKSWKFKNNKTVISVTNDNVDVMSEDSNISILGYEVTGHVISDGQPIKGVQFALFSNNVRKSVLGCDSSSLSISKPPHEKWIYLCHVSSNANGLFVFESIPNGNYNLLPFYRGKNIQFDVKPSELIFDVQNENIQLNTIFKIEGFSVSGIVSDGVKGVSKAEITLIDETTEKKQIIFTQENGVYNLENVKSGNYKLLAKANHMYFLPITVKISPTTSQLPDLIPNEFDVCGRLVFKISAIKSITISVFNSKITKSTISDDSGLFCITLKTGEYTVKPLSSESDTSIQFTPSEFSIKILSKPILDLIFTQFTASISGSIKSIDTSNDLQIQLYNKRLAHSNILKYSQLKKIGEKLEFKFNDILPDLYSISIIKESNSWCWEKETLDVEVTNKDVNGLDFVQKGYILSLYFSHSIDLKLKYPSNKVEILKVDDNHSIKHCVSESGKYSISPIGCHKFIDSGSDVITFDSAKDAGKLISRTAVKHSLSANIITNLNVTDIVLTVKIKSYDREEFTERLHLQQQNVIKKENVELYEYPILIWVKPMVNIYLEPSSSHLLFKPSYFETKMEDNCLHNLLTFNGKTGVFVNGKITPTLEGVVIKIFSGDNVIFTVKSDSLGKYIAGPFDSETELTITGEKEGYVLKSNANKLGYFEAIRLSQVFVRVNDSNNKPLADVLVSISGGKDNYRKNSVTPANGYLEFNNLHEGQYFVRIMMKEYEFEPSTKMIDVHEGSKVLIEVNAKKVAFSCIGITDSLNGDPEAGVAVEAIGLRNVVMNAKINCSQLQEETISEPNGSFRIKGLFPQCHYAVRIKSSDENRHIYQTIPVNHLIRVEDKDVSGIRLIILRKMTHMDVSGDVVTDFDFLSTLKVRLFSELNPDQSITALTLGSSPFFFFPPLPIDYRNYFIRLESSLSTNIYDFDNPIKSLRANTSHLHFTFHFNPKLKNSANSGIYNEQELISQGSIYTLPILIIITLLIYNYNKISVISVQAFSYINRISAMNIRNFEIDSTANAIKRKIKSKKI